MALSDKDLLFLPLGGAGEIGMNMNLYSHAGQWLMIDCGVTFGDDTVPGIDVVMPDPAFIVERRDRLCGLVLTHAHEDHLGAVPWLWPQLRCPVYATPFAASLLRRKLEEAGLDGTVELTEVAPSSRFAVGPFDLELVTLTHSIPEPNGVIVRTPAGTVLHTGDWKIDPDPQLGETTDEAALRRVGAAGVLAMVGDSTNALVAGEAGSEGSVLDGLMAAVADRPGRVAVACFASNVARLQTIGKVAKAHGRSVVLAGRSMHRIVEAARETGYLLDFPPVTTEMAAHRLPRDKMLLVCTGSQGEYRAALPKIARRDHPHLTLDAGDTVIFSSRIIPGNEKAIGRLQNSLLDLGVTVVTAADAPVHVSGHPARDELIRMYQWVKPHIAVPVHGEVQHMLAHAEVAEACQVPHSPVIANGDLLRLAPDGPTVVDRVHHGRLTADGSRLLTLNAEEIRRRQRMLWNGTVMLTLVVGGDGALLADPRLATPGLFTGADEALLAGAVDDLVADLERLPRDKRQDDAALETAARRSLRRFIRAHRGKNPHMEVHVVRV